MAIFFVRAQREPGSGLLSPSQTCVMAPPVVSGWKLASIIILLRSGMSAEGLTWELFV